MTLAQPLALALALSLSAAAIAQTPPSAPPGPPRDPWGEADVTREESQAKAGQMFDGMDTDKDGTIKQAEEDSAVLAAGPAGRMIGAALNRADENGDGKLTREEFLTGQQTLFDRQDADKDGKLTKVERDAARAAMMERMKQRRAAKAGGFGPPSGN